MPIIDLDHVDFSYGDHHVLDDVSFTVNNGDYLGIIGPNGSGKTTLLKIMLGLLEPTRGSVKLFSDKKESSLNRPRIGYVPQRVAQTDFNFPATVREVIESGLLSSHSLSFTGAEDRRAVERAMKMTGVTKNQHRLIGQLSGGERQRVFIARALVTDPELLILDEPTVGVDIASQEEFYTLLCELNAKHGLTIVLVSHDIDVVAQEVRTVLFLNGKVVAYGEPHDVIKENYLEKLYGGQVKLIVHHHKD